MNRILTTVAMLLLCGTLTFASTDRGRNSHSGNNKKTEQKLPASRPGSAARPGGSSSHSHHNNSSKPSQGNHNNGHSGNKHTGDKHHSGHNNYRPGNNWNHNHDKHRPPMNPGHVPGHNHGHSHAHLPHHYGWYRPTPPPHWHPVHTWRPFRSILGIAFGTTVNLTLNALMNSGYTVTSYGNNNVYVSNVPMLNLVWPDAVLFYNNGGLCGSRFIYSTPYYDQGRYNAAYASLIRSYGSPVSIQNTNSGGVEATWWGSGNQFIRLSYDAAYAQDGGLRYFTTLSFGN
ncbi:MAG: hypothetical protein K2M97_07485 [Muribaculaceae bacterium]|nr:hypothetical protein [Muribaculaceae bacterium]